MTKANPSKKDLIVLDFDQTIYYNPNYDLSFSPKLYNVVRAKDFFFELFEQTEIPQVYKPYFVLITGRQEDQRRMVLHALKQKGYQIDTAYFNPTDQSVFLNNKGEIDPNKFLINYWCWKCMVINELKNSRDFGSIMVLEDDLTICHMLINLNITTLKTEFIIHNNELNIIFKEFNNNKKTFEILNSDLKCLYEGRDRKYEQISI